MAPVANSGDFDQAPMTADQQAAQTRLQAAVEEREVEFSLGNDTDMGTQTEEFTDEFHDMMSKPVDGNLKETEGGPDDELVEPEDVIEILEPKSEHKAWKVGPGGELQYIQRPLSFIQKMQWFALVGEMLDKAMSGSNPLSLADLFDNPTAKAAARASRTGKTAPEITIKNIGEADTFIRALGKIIQHAPEFLLDSYVIWLGVPSHEKSLVRELFEMPEEEGGLSDEMGTEMIEIFIDQNWDALESFFSERIGGIQKRIASRQEIKRRAVRA